MRESPHTAAPRGLLTELVRRADARRRARLVLASVARALWPGLIAATVLSAAWRLRGGTPLAAAVGACVVLPVVFGLAAGFRRRDLLAAASELDRRSALEAALATGLEVAAGRISGPLAGAALAEAELAAAGVRLETVPVAPARARYLAVPAAVLAGVLLVPGGGSRAPAGHILVPADGRVGDAAELAPDDVAAATKGGRREARPDGVRDRRPDGDERVGRDEVAVLPPPPPRTRARRRKGGGARAGGGIGPEAARAPGGTGASTSEGDTGAWPGSGDASGEVDLGESGVVLERFPEYEELVRRYFAGPSASSG